MSSSNTDNNESYCTTTMESERSGMAHCHTAVNLSSPESAYSTGIYFFLLSPNFFLNSTNARYTNCFSEQFFLHKLQKKLFIKELLLKTNGEVSISKEANLKLKDPYGFLTCHLLSNPGTFHGIVEKERTGGNCSQQADSPFLLWKKLYVRTSARNTIEK